MKKLVLLIILFFSIPVFSQETGILRGKVINSSNLEPVPAANVVIEELNLGGASDPSGKYIITKIKPGTYTVKITAVGYKPVEIESVEIKAGETTRLDPALATRAPLPDSDNATWGLYSQDIDPKFKVPLEEIKRLDVSKFQDLARKTYFNRLRFRGDDPFNLYLSKMNDEIIKLELESEKIALDYKNAKGAEKESLKKDLENLLNKLFTKREELKQKEVDDLTKELAELKESLDLRKKNKETIIRRRLEELLGNGDIYDW